MPTTTSLTTHSTQPSQPLSEPRWCAHIEHDDVGRDCDWWLLVPFSNIIAVDDAWRCCPICSAPRPAGTS